MGLRRPCRVLHARDQRDSKFNRARKHDIYKERRFSRQVPYEQIADTRRRRIAEAPIDEATLLIYDSAMI